MLHITIKGQVKSKKNNKRWTGHGLICSKAFMEWHAIAVPQINAQKGNAFYEHCKIIVHFYHDSEKRRRDADNGLNSVYDTLVDCNVITDDSWQILPKGYFENYYDKANPRCEVYIYSPEEKVTIEF